MTKKPKNLHQAKPVKAWCWKHITGRLDLEYIYKFKPKEKLGRVGCFVRVEIREVRGGL